MSKNKTPKELTDERKNTHGDWVEQATMAGVLKANLHAGVNWDSLTYMQQEALDMIAVKISRILNGDPNEPDHWDDISGYAHLGKGGHGQ